MFELRMQNRHWQRWQCFLFAVEIVWTIDDNASEWNSVQHKQKSTPFWKRWFISLVRNDRLQCLKKIYAYIWIYLEKKIGCWLPTVILKTLWHNKNDTKHTENATFCYVQRTFFFIFGFCLICMLWTEKAITKKKTA